MFDVIDNKNKKIRQSRGNDGKFMAREIEEFDD
jgi:hypothetical protein